MMGITLVRMFTMAVVGTLEVVVVEVAKAEAVVITRITNSVQLIEMEL